MTIGTVNARAMRERLHTQETGLELVFSLCKASAEGRMLYGGKRVVERKKLFSSDRVCDIMSLSVSIQNNRTGTGLLFSGKDRAMNMKKTTRRSLALLLCLALFLSLLTGCAEKAAPSAPAEETAAETPAPAATAAPAEEPVEPAPEEGKTFYDPEELFGFSFDGVEGQQYDSETVFGFDYEGEPVQTLQEEARLTGGLEGALPEEPVEAFVPMADDTLQMAGQSDVFEDGIMMDEAGLLPQPLIQTAGGGLTDDGIVASTLGTGSAPRQLTIEDIQAMNPDSVVIDIYTNNGYLSTLVGKYYDKKVNNMEDGVLSIQGMASLLGLSKGCEFFAVYSETNEKGYTFYTYQQRYGGYTLRYATLRIVVDPEGYTAGLTCSFVPNIGTASQEAKISKARAEQIVKSRYASQNLTYYPEQTVRLAVTLNFMVYNCYVVYTSNPDASSAGGTSAFDMPYLEHFVSTDGSYLTKIPANNFATENIDAIDNSGYFEGLQTQIVSRTVKLQDGSSREIAVPVSYNSRDGKYYLMDPSRMIAVAQYYDLNYLGKVNLISSSTPDGWSDNNLMAYANYIIMYDFYADHGIRSVDGFGVPILVTVGWCESDGSPVDNACFYGVKQGWACFGVSDINHDSDCVDVVGHEFTHGVTNLSMQGSIYQNETGAINEAYSDIMGNLAEMSLGFTGDQRWLVAERSGRTCRDMSDPNRYAQPAFVGDVYYCPSVLNPDFDVNDYGGVHINNSLLGHIAYRMGQTGMSYEQQIGMWLNSIELLTPRSDYEDLHGALLFALKINGLLNSYGGELNKAFADAGLNDDWSKTYLSAAREGYGRLTFETDEKIAEATTRVFFQNEKKQNFVSFPDENGIVSVMVPAGRYIAQISEYVDGQRGANYNYTGSGWVQGGSFYTVTVKAGDSVELVGTSGPKPGQGSGTAQQNLNLITLNAGYFSMLIPDGWRIEVAGEYGGAAFKIFDPNDPSTQMFLYGGLAPYHKSESTRNFWRRYDTMIGNGPVLPVANILGILATWDYAIQYQVYYEGKQSFTSLYDMKVIDGAYYNGPYASVGAIESGAVVRCGTNYDDDCVLTIAGALVDNDDIRMFGGNMFYACYGLCGILAPADRYDAVMDDLRTCLESITFSQDYIRASQSSSTPLFDQATTTRNLQMLSGILRELYDTFG